MRKVFPWLGLVAFIVMLGAYMNSRSDAGSSGAAAPEALTQEIIDGDEDGDWMAISYQGSRIGWSQTQRVVNADSEHIDERIYLNMELMGQPRDVTSRQQLVLNKAGVLKSFIFTMEAAGGNIRIEGAQNDGKLDLIVHSGGATQAVSHPAPEPIVMSGNLSRMLAEAGMKVGETMTRSFFDPSVMRPAAMKIRIEAKESWKVGDGSVDVYKLSNSYNGLESTSWVDAQGRTYREESTTGFASFRTTQVEARKLGGGLPLDLIAATSVPTENPAPRPRNVKRIVMDLSGVDLEGFELDGDGQRLEGNRLTIDRNAHDATKIERASFLGTETLMQVDHPRIHEAARKATGDEAEAGKASRLILDWVYKNLKKTSTVSLPSALEVLSTMQGDCNEHAILYTAMTRASDIPSRVASGIVAMDDRFYYHAWTELYLDGRWLAVDPVFGQYPADATHIRFVSGGLERQADLMRVIGKLKIKVIAYEES